MTSFAWTALNGYRSYPPYVNLTDGRLTVRGDEFFDAETGFVREGKQATIDLPPEALQSLRQALIDELPDHKYWGAGEPGCPPELKAGNGELHTLRCKVCGSEDLRRRICLGATKGAA